MATGNDTTSSGMPLVESLQVLRDTRGDDEVVLTVMGTAREWMALGDLHPLDWIYVPSSMGQAPSLGLGMALAQPGKNVVVCNGDGCLLMNLGSLVTITQQAPKNLTLIIFDNGIYEITGGQPTPAIDDDGSRVDYPGLARAAGFQQVHVFDDLVSWQAAARDLIDADGPTFIHLSISPVPGASGPRSPSKAPPRAHAFAKSFRAD
ncbi:MAG: thiamine pyrophosphate-binding protein [Planctomycetaceae bacterium]|jgi:thiamine pyrophosphate-dependent acetolactate synthase large subunit-like protein|nr:thiamine pyrophosphate-binding protein [Planctomycetaceae bacterium]MDP7275269.1 thiamine pyrophosphate-dependent enzyme [Planctomycetaceae bacterium]